MDNMTLDFVEAILEWWEWTFSWFIWKAFPNDNDLSNKVWNSIILKDNDMNLIIKNSFLWLKKLYWEDYKINKKDLYNELVKEVSYHEFWHSLFIKWNKSSKMEEAKATLFYYLKVFDENSNIEYSNWDIKIVVDFTIMDSIRNLERIKEERSLKYVILTKVNLLNLFESGLIKFNWDNLETDLNNKKFDIFLLNQKKELDYIEKLYKLDNNEIIKQDQIYLKKLDEKVMWIINKMIDVLK
jgi:hypothetical protein